MQINPSKFSMLPPERQDEAYAKIVDDRDAALRVSSSMARKIEILAQHIVIRDSKLRLANPKLTKYELKALSECLEEDEG